MAGAVGTGGSLIGITVILTTTEPVAPAASVTSTVTESVPLKLLLGLKLINPEALMLATPLAAGVVME